VLFDLALIDAVALVQYIHIEDDNLSAYIFSQLARVANAGG
jgi:hypothetical protein